MTPRTPCLARGFLLALGLALTAPAFAGEREHDALRRALELGEIQSLSQIIAKVHGSLPGEIVGVEAEHKHDRWVYEFRVTDKAGKLYDVYVDAKTGMVLKTKEK